MGWDEIKKARRRLSRERGAVIKDWGGRLPIALIYPNSYYIGMSSLGVQSVYSLLNGCRGVVCERVFWEKENESRKSSPLSLESQRPLTDFAVIAFSINYEIDYLNVARILKSGGIPVLASERDGSHPLVIAGGACITANPMPLAPFFDGLCVGEAEVILPGMLSRLVEAIKAEREQLLEELASISGVYVPGYHAGAPVARQWPRELDDFPVASSILTPDTELGDLYLIEVGRGCDWGCQFCLVSRVFSPVRFHSVASIIAQAEVGLTLRKRVGLVGPAVSDHPQIEELLIRLKEMGAGLSVSSLRIKPLSRTVLKTLAEAGAQSISLAPEAGSQRLRKLVRKGISEDDILEAVSSVSGLGIKNLKLYFMIGLPSEMDEDITAIADLAAKCNVVLDQSRSGTRLSLNIAPFVPKAGTPWERQPMASLDTLNRRLVQLKKSLPQTGIKIKVESPAWSEVQAVLSRGDSKVAQVLLDIEEVSLPAWRRSVLKHNLNVDFYAHREWDETQELPWAVIDAGR